MVKAELLATYGFWNDKGKDLFGSIKDLKERKKKVDTFKGDINNYVEEEKREIHVDRVSETGYPKSGRSCRLVYENYSMSLEEMYYWILTQMTVDHGFKRDEVIKITDVFAASETSSYWGIHTQRLNIQQDRASQYLKFVADMTKTMFQLIRDLNIVDEKTGYYESSYSDNDDEAINGDMILKGQYTDLVEGGPKNPSSIFGMAQNYGFVTLPDLFFQARPFGGKVRDEKEFKKVIESIHSYVHNTIGKDFGNPQLLNILEQKLGQYYRWKYRTYKQLKTYRKLYKGYLKQHYNNIRLYMNWVKPYLRNIRRLNPNSGKALSSDLIAAFEGEMIEIEILAHKKKKPKDKYASVVLANFDYRTVPQLEWVPHAQERRSVMVGRAEMNLKAYAWTDDQIENYRKMKEAEDMELLKEVDESIGTAMDALEEDLKKYLDEKDEGDEKEVKSKEKKWNIEKGKFVEVTGKKANKSNSSLSLRNTADPFIQVFKGFEMLLKPFSFKIDLFKGSSKKDNKKAAIGEAKLRAWLLYKFYKKAHQLLSW